MQGRAQSRRRTKGRRTTRPHKAKAAGSAISDLQGRLAQRTRERDETLEQLEATSEVLRVISSSRGELQPVFQEILKSAVRICGAKFGNLWLREGDGVRIGAMRRPYADFMRAQGLIHTDDRVG